MTENLAENQVIRPSYESLEQAAPGKGGEKLRALNKARAQYSEFVRELKDDPKYSLEYKSEQAWARYAKTKTFVEETAAEAIKDFERSAELNERFSIPVPEHEPLVVTDVNKLLLTVHERERIERLLDRAEKQSERGPLKIDPREVLKREYARGLSQGGPSGGATVRAIYELARDMQIDIHELVDPHRRDSHRKAFDDMERAMFSRNLVVRRVSEPDLPHPNRIRSRGSDFHTGRGQNAFVNNRGVPQPVRSSGHVDITQPRRRKPSWK